MRNDYQSDIIGARVRTSTPPSTDLGPLFAPIATVAPKATPRPRTRSFWELEGERRARDTYARLDSVSFPSPAQFAELAARSDVAERLLIMAERVAAALLDATGRMAVWEVRVQLVRLNLVGPKDSLDCLGALGTRMGLEAIGVERPPVLAELAASHRNRNTVWRRKGDIRRAG